MPDWDKLKAEKVIFDAAAFNTVVAEIQTAATAYINSQEHIMLAKYWRLRGLWTADQTLTYNSDARVEVNWYGWKLTAGALVYSAESTDDFGFVAAETWATTVQKEITVVDNSSNLYLGVKGTLEVKADADSTDGTMALYLEESTDNTV